MSRFMQMRAVDDEATLNLLQRAYDDFRRDARKPRDLLLAHTVAAKTNPKSASTATALKTDTRRVNSGP